MNATTVVSGLTYAEAARIVNEAVRNKEYQLTPLGMEAAGYLRHNRKRFTDGTFRKYESALDKLAKHYPYLELKDFEPPVGTERLEEFMDEHWGHQEPRTYNSNLSAVKEFFKWAHAHGKLHGDPALLIQRAKARQPHRETFTTDQLRAIIAAQPELRDRIVLRLLLNYGLRKAAIRAVQFKHFDHVRRRLTVFLKGGKNRPLPIPDPAFWHDLERLILDSEAEPGHFLMPGRRGNRHGSRLLPSTRISNHGLHDWWYRCLENAGIVATGTTKGERMHKARHTAGQNLLDATGNLKAVQKLLGHESIMTTSETYVDWDIDQLAGSMRETLRSLGEDGE